ncbi:PaaI family thioesterase [Vibrio sp.]|uniref:PaaI family thioesterase n=1 Tax=Vibrio sp. TaxID=678 RepID=UPI003AA7B58D
MTALSKANQHLKYFGEQLVPMIGYCQPEILKLTDESVEIKIPLNKETQNHLHSMYFGALAVGADAAGGFLAISKSEQMGKKISLAFKAVNAEFLARPEADVVFVCNDGKLIDQMLAETIETGERVNQPVRITALCPSLNDDKPMAEFELTLSVKVVGN